MKEMKGPVVRSQSSSDVLRPPPSPVSMMAAQEYDGMKEQLDLEQSLRVTAETYAHEVSWELA